MTERSWFWDNGGGDGASYDDDTFMDRYFRMLFNGTGNRGVLRNWLDELEVTDGGANTATVLAGGAILYGMFYESDGAENINVPNGPRTDLIVVRRDMDAQTCRLARIAGPGAVLVQDAPPWVPGDLYDIPLASVDVDAGGNLTITDTREWCEYTFYPVAGSVTEDALGADVVTTAILENQTRWRVHGAGMLRPDDSNPPQWIMIENNPNPGIITAIIPYWQPMNCAWRMDPSGIMSLWLTDRVPEDFTGTDLNIYVWNVPDITGDYEGWSNPDWRVPWPTTGNVVWGWNSWDGASGAAFASQSGSTTVDNTGRTGIDTNAEGAPNMYRDFIGTITVSAGDLVHIEVYRDGPDGADTVEQHIKLMAVEIAYTADS
ncbi:MAG TPA: hypothetical protein VM537_01330 [Anaerolineae bacterium]|nr:hypothetical protein [Anaerolineae bacterium]